mmetsp:Transcript_43496/g.105443  ORF Transcript_43496/g.105443 Transcript_43496/m.105443 type:complete len:441 (+) Transcript_43496:679-2001(+)
MTSTSVLEVISNILLFALVFGMSATVDIQCLRHQIKNIRAILLGVICQFLLLPVLGFAVVKLFDLEPAVGITLLVVTSSPGGSYSNWFCSIFNADLALSVTLTAISTLLSTIALPANLLLYANLAYHADVTSELDWISVFIALAVVISAIAMGLYCSYRSHSYKFNILCNKIGNVSGFLLIVFSATVTNTGDADSRIWSRHWSFYVAIMLPCIMGLIIASGLATLLKLLKPEQMTVAVECCYQNVGIATSLALTMFKGNDLNQAMGVPFFYGLCEAFFVGTYCIICWKAGWSKAPRDASIWTVVATTYEVLEAEMKSICEIEVSISSSSSDGSEKPAENEEGNVLTTYFPMSDQYATAHNQQQLQQPTPPSPKKPSGYITVTRDITSDKVMVSYPQQVSRSGSRSPTSVEITGSSSRGSRSARSGRSLNEDNSGLFNAEC